MNSNVYAMHRILKRDEIQYPLIAFATSELDTNWEI